MRKINLVLVVALVALVMLFAACNQSPAPQVPAVPTTQLSTVEWVDSYSLISSDPNAWEHYPFDEQGIVQVDYGNEIGIQYNAVTIAQYALANYKKYLLTQEDKYITNFLIQIEYLRNNFDVIGEDMAGFPYHFPMPHYGLEPVWYSGMAQGQVVSVLARAYLLTHDKTILPFIKEVNNFMLYPVSKGGTLTYTLEGNVWIEEYPSKEPSLVLNGFMFSILALYDYTHLFPEVSEVYQIYSSCLKSLKESLKYYDTGSWLKYCRLDDRLCGRNYMDVQVRQMKQLFAITNDSYFDSMATKWESYLQGEEENCIVTNGWYHVPPKSKNLAAWSNIADWDSTDTCAGYGVEALFDDDQSTYFAPAKYDLSDTNPHYIRLKLESEVVADSLVLTLYNRELLPEVLDVLYRSNQNPEWLKLDTVAVRDSDDMHIIYRFDELPVSELELVCSRAAEQNRLILSEIALTGRELEVTGYGVYYPDIIQIDSPFFEVQLKAKDINEDKIFVLYKYADEIEGLSTKIWEFQTINPLERNRTPTLGKYYQFKIIFKNETASSGFTDFKVIPRK